MNRKAKIQRTITTNKISAIILTGVILLVLVLSGPAAAFSIKLGNFSDSNPVKGSKVSSTLSLEILGNERVNPILEIYINDEYVCTAGNCSSINITLVSDNSSYGYGYGYSQGYNYGYGYGYGNNNGILVYNIEIDTGVLSVGENRIMIKANLNGRNYSSEERLINVKAQTSNSGGRFEESVNPVTLPDTELEVIPSVTNSNNTEVIELVENTEEDSNKNSGITGAVIGALGSSLGIGIIIFLAVILGLGITVNIIRRKKIKSEFSSY